MPEMKTKWNFRPLVALLPMALLAACAEVGPGYYGGGYGGGYGGYGGGIGGGYYGGGPWWGGGFNGWGNGGRGVCRVCGYNPCRCRNDQINRRDDRRDDRDDRREQVRTGGSGGGTAYRLKEAERDEPAGWHSRKWFDERGYKFSRNTWENRDGRTIQGSEIRKSGGESERRKETVSEQRGGGRSSGASRGSDGGEGRSSGSSRGGGSERGSGGGGDRSGGGKRKD